MRLIAKVIGGIGSILGTVGIGWGIKVLTDRYVYGKDGYNGLGYDREGRDREGRDKEGRDRQGFDRWGRDINGRDRYGYDDDGYDVFGYDRQGYDKQHYNKDGEDKSNHTREYYRSKIKEMSDLAGKAHTQMKEKEFPYALHDIRIGLVIC